MKIEKRSLRDQAVEALRRRILLGAIAPGAVLREEQLAGELGISRTPLREALLELMREELITKRTGRGFKASRLQSQHARELYPMRALLESEALRRSGIPEPERLAELTALNERIKAEQPGTDWIDLDNQWHDLLIDRHSNRYLRSFLRVLRTHSFRYELAFLDAVGDPVVSTTQHSAVLSFLYAGRLSSACQALSENIVAGMEPLVGWLEPADHSQVSK